MKWYHWLGSFFFILIAMLLLLGCWINKPLPEGTQGPEADAMADKMLEAINFEAWDNLNFVEWTFRGSHDFLWDKSRNYVCVRWKNYESFIDPGSGKGIVMEKGVRVIGDKEQKLLDKAILYFYNDSFWLNAPSKVYDQGTIRQYVILEEGKEGLLVTYSSGGETPGDSYLWLLDDSGRPVKWMMWVKILPVKGLATSWEDWIEVEGSWIARSHKLAFLKINISNLKVGDTYSVFGYEQDPFSILEGMK